MKQLLILLFSSITLFSASAEYKISKEWKADAGTEVELSGRNQNFKVEFWDKAVVRIDFFLSTSDTKIDEEDFRNGLKVSAEKSAGKLTVTTDLSDLNTGNVWNRIFNSGKKPDYTTRNIVYLPRNISSVIFSMNYCELSVGETNLPLKVTCNYGNFSLEKNTGRTILHANYAELKLGNLSYLKCGTAYSEFKTAKIDTLILASSYDDIQITDCGIIQSLIMSYGDIIIQQAAMAKITGTYSDIKIHTLTQGITAILTYSDLSLNAIGKNLSGITVTGTYADCSIKVNPENPVNISITDVNGHIDIKNPGISVSKKIETSKTRSISAKTKTATDTSPVIKITGNNSTISIL
jgi:hypothetical protein